MDVLKVAIIGIGNMGSAHALCISNGEIEGLCLCAVCDVEERKLNTFAEKYPHISVYTDYRELLKNNMIDAVIIAVPHPYHAEIAIAALKSGKHVLLEKPADISVSRVQKLNEEAQRSGRIFGIMFNQRTHPLFKKARDIVRGGMLGELKRTVWIVTNWYRTQSYYNSSDWRATWSGEGGGVLLNQAPHNLDLWQWICGMPESVTAFLDIAKYHNIEVEDDATILTRYKNGATGTFITSTGEYPGTNRLEISGDKGKLVLENGTLKWWQLKTSEREVCFSSEESFANIDYDYFEFREDECESGHKRILRNFADSVLYGDELIAPGTDGIYELTLSNAAYLSSFHGNKEVALPFDTDEFDKLLNAHIAVSEYHYNKAKSISLTGYSDRWKVNW